MKWQRKLILMTKGSGGKRTLVRFTKSALKVRSCLSIEGFKALEQRFTTKVALAVLSCWTGALLAFLAWSQDTVLCEIVCGICFGGMFSMSFLWAMVVRSYKKALLTAVLFFPFSSLPVTGTVGNLGAWVVFFGGCLLLLCRLWKEELHASLL